MSKKTFCGLGLDVDPALSNTQIKIIYPNGEISFYDSPVVTSEFEYKAMLETFALQLIQAGQKDASLVISMSGLHMLERDVRFLYFHMLEWVRQ